MKLAASLSMLLLATAAAVSGQGPMVWPADVEARVLRLVSSELGAPPESLVLEWGLYRGESVLPDGAVELIGSGSGGYWVVRASLPSGARASVRVRAGRMAERAVAGRRVERGEALQPEDIVFEQEMIWGAQGPEDPEVQVGWVAQRLLRPGDVLSTPAVQPPLAVLSGRAVELVWTRGAIGIRTPGTAAGSAAIGGRVSVRTQAGEKLTGVVVAPGVVDVTSGEPN